MAYIIHLTSGDYDCGSKGALEDAAQRYVNAGEGDVLCTCGKATKTCREVVDARNSRNSAWLERKQQTHKLVRVTHGASVACYVNKWVRK